MLQEYKVTLPTGFETKMLMTEDYQKMFYPDAVLVSDDASTPRRRARHRVAEPNDDAGED